MAQEYFKSAEGGLLVDVSCGSGLFSRKFANSGTYSGVIALDFSENMLRQCNNCCAKGRESLTQTKKQAEQM
jgi:ubiquinone/menaquinone biosynthesis C-methylase UbiE